MYLASLLSSKADLDNNGCISCQEWEKFVESKGHKVLENNKLAGGFLRLIAYSPTYSCSPPTVFIAAITVLQITFYLMRYSMFLFWKSWKKASFFTAVCSRRKRWALSAILAREAGCCAPTSSTIHTSGRKCGVLSLTCCSTGITSTSRLTASSNFSLAFR